MVLVSPKFCFVFIFVFYLFIYFYYYYFFNKWYLTMTWQYNIVPYYTVSNSIAFKQNKNLWDKTSIANTNYKFTINNHDNMIVSYIYIASVTKKVTQKYTRQYTHTKPHIVPYCAVWFIGTCSAIHLFHFVGGFGWFGCDHVVWWTPSLPSIIDFIFNSP